ncbi:carboxylate-amine ligase [Nocardiopsis mwathae]|uniref:Putative glutamate--cysteine ligase 2 n=1 Tax=Nocardiopsis mwathae TaxID=1472723 RepID=A0A7X0D605_9ACTN|nr:glutamate--cysteine ligase [Nocardiopsis mwathae]MBB6173012.1 carboxylate-amine ligase [Nocardiopsis mwathae]
MKSARRSDAKAQPLVTSGPDRHSASDGKLPVTVGVEEEYLLVDPSSRQLSTQADQVVARAAGELGDQVTTELTRYQIEIRTDPHTSLAALDGQLRTARTAVARAATELGLRIISSGTPILGQHTPLPVSPGPRYSRSIATFRALDHEQSACACHIHVGIPDLATALQLSNHLRPWLPSLIALTANSPYWTAQDTGYASWRTMTWGRWPVAGPPPYFESRTHYEDLLDSLLRTETLMDRGGLYWDIRPSHHVPTLEVRVADATPTVDDTVLLAGAVKGLATGALAAIREGRPAPRPQPEMLRAACWRAARDGLNGKSVDVHTERLEPVAAHFKRFWAASLPALGADDLAPLRAARERLRAKGNGADRQRRAYRRRHRLTDVVDHLVRSTATAEHNAQRKRRGLP